MIILSISWSWVFVAVWGLCVFLNHDYSNILRAATTLCHPTWISHTMLRKCQVAPISMLSLKLLCLRSSCEAYAGMPVIDIHLGCGTCFGVSIFGMWGIVSFVVVGVCIQLHAYCFVPALLLSTQIYDTCIFMFFSIYSCEFSNDLLWSIVGNWSILESFVKLLLCYNSLPFYYLVVIN